MRRVPGLLVMILCFGVAPELSAEEPNPLDWPVSTCKPCHQATSLTAEGASWDAQSIYPALPLEILRSEGFEPSGRGDANKVPLDTTAHDFALWQELLKKGANRKGDTCFSCHLGAKEGPRKDLSKSGVQVSLDLAAMHAWLRTPGDAHKESFGLWVDASTHRTVLKVTVKILNYAGGHRIPVDPEGKEGIVLVMETQDGYGKPLKFIRGPRLPQWMAKNAGQDGYLYAKVLEGANGKPTDSLKEARGVLMDTRLQGGEHDEFHFYYELPESAPESGKAWKVGGRLVWRSSLLGEGKDRVMESAFDEE